jgi:hypothetical protein
MLPALPHPRNPGYRLGSDRGSPNHGSTLLSKRVMARIRSPVSVRTLWGARVRAASLPPSYTITWDTTHRRHATGGNKAVLATARGRPPLALARPALKSSGASELDRHDFSRQSHCGSPPPAAAAGAIGSYAAGNRAHRRPGGRSPGRDISGQRCAVVHGGLGRGRRAEPQRAVPASGATRRRRRSAIAGRAAAAASMKA